MVATGVVWHAHVNLIRILSQDPLFRDEHQCS